VLVRFAVAGGYVPPKISQAGGHRPPLQPTKLHYYRRRVVSRLGFEPRTPALKGQCSTIELPAQHQLNKLTLIAEFQI